MACKTTFAAERRAAFTLVELVVVVAIACLVVVTVILFSMFSGRTLLAAGNRMDLEAQSRYALDVLTREMRSSIELTACTSNSVTFADFNNKTLRFTHDPARRQLIWSREGQKDVVLLNDCDQVGFAMYGRAPTSGTFELEPVTDPALCKAVNVSLYCTRTFIAPRIQAMNVLTATIVLRMK